jgi:hypothetical protein
VCSSWDSPELARIENPGKSKQDQRIETMFSFDTVSKDLDATIYAAHVRGILLYHITVLQKAVSYGKLAKATGDMPSGGQLAQALARIAEHDHFAGKPLSTAIVVREDTGIPGSGFFNQCRKLGYDILDDPAAEVLFWRSAMTKLGIEDAFDADPLSALLHRPISGREEISVLSSMWRTPETEGTPEKPTSEAKPVKDPQLFVSNMADIQARDIREARSPDARICSEIKAQDLRIFGEPRNRNGDARVCSDIKAQDPNAVATQKEHIYVPAWQLEKGDIVHLPDHVSPFVVESVTQPLLRGDPRRVVRWSSMGRNFETECGSHLKINMPERLKKATGKPRRRVVSTRLVP